MRQFLASCVSVCWLAASPIFAGEAERPWPEAFHEDANLFDVCFVDTRHGWAVGDRGTIVHTADGGQTWSVQSSPVACRLESVQFINTRQGWVVGGYTAPYTHRAVGVMLKTDNGGQSWKRVEGQFLPWLTQVQLLDAQRGFVLGIPSSMFPSAAFRTTDGGQHWTPWPGRSDGWIHGQFNSRGVGLLLDRSGHLSVADPSELRPLATQPTDPRLPLRVCLSSSQHGLLCGNQGLLYQTRDGGQSWQKPRDLPAARAMAEFDWLALDGINQRFWMVGVPGSRVLHTADGGESWKLSDTGHALPLFGLDFVDADHGWAVGALGAVLSTVDGGRSWTGQRAAGRRLAVMGVFGHPDLVPWELWAQFCAGEGSYAAIEVLSAPIVPGQESGHVPLSSRLHEAVVLMGGVGANLIQSLPAPRLESQYSPDQIQASWDQALRADSRKQLIEYLVRQFRLWRPDMVTLGDPLQRSSGLPQTIHRLVLRAVELAADPQQFADQIQHAGLQAWRVPRVGTQTDDMSQAGYKVVSSRQALDWGQSMGSISSRARSLVQDGFAPGPSQLGLVVAGSQVEAGERSGSAQHTTRIVGEQQATRRPTGRLPDNLPQLHKQYQARRTIETLLDSSSGIPAARWPQIARLAEALPPADRGEVLYQSAVRLLARGNSDLAWQLLTQLTGELPDHPLAEAARLGLFHRAASVEASLHWPLQTGNLAVQTLGELPRDEPGPTVNLTSLEQPQTSPGKVPLPQTTQQAVTRRRSAVEQALRLAEQFRLQQPDLFFEPYLRFPLAAALSRSGQQREAVRLWRSMLSGADDSFWRKAALDELAWQQHEPGADVTQQTWQCRRVAQPPYLDGQLDDAAWSEITGVRLKGQPGGVGRPPVTEVLLAYDERFLYLAARCAKVRAEDRGSTPETRQRDANLSHSDRLEWHLDVDRDHVTWWHLTVDDRGWASDRLNQDPTWNPTWYIASGSDPQTWTVESAIALEALTPEPSVVTQAWRISCQRVVPGHGRQVWTGKPGAPSQAEQYGLLVFE